MKKRLIRQKPGSIAHRCMKRKNDTKRTDVMSEVRTNEVVNVVVVMEQNTAVCLVSFIRLPEKLHEMNELSEVEWSCAKRSVVQRNGVEGSERMKFAFCYYFFGMLWLIIVMHMLDAINFDLSNNLNRKHWKLELTFVEEF